MGTRSTIKFITKRKNEKLPHEYDYTPLVSVYQQWDGYVEGVGYDLANYLKSKKIINDISYGQNTDEYANGFECLIAQFIRDFKKEVGGFYITDIDDVEEYNYEVIFDEDKYFSGDYDTTDDLITIKVDTMFEGTPSELLAFKENDDDEE